MTTNRVIAATETDPGAPLVSALFKALANNVIAAFEGDATAVAAGVQVRRPALKTTLATQAFSIPASTGLFVTLNDYCFLPSVYVSGGGLTVSIGSIAAASEVSRLYLLSGGTSSTGTVYWRYLTP